MPTESFTLANLHEDDKHNLCNAQGCVIVPVDARSPCEVYSRVVGYLRPVAQWNKGKQSEWRDRVDFIAK